MEKGTDFLKDILIMVSITALLFFGFYLVLTDRTVTVYTVTEGTRWTSNAPAAESGPAAAQLITEDPLSDSYHEMAELNPDLAGWLTIPGTIIDYPVMYSPDEPERYLHRGFDLSEKKEGTPFIDASCSLNPRSDNLIIYGHHMKDKSMFGMLDYYAEQVYFMKHPRISFDTLEERGDYEIFSVFYDRVYYEDEDVFKFYRFIDAKDQKDFDSSIQTLKEKSLYDTGVTPEYGDQILMLVTCEYQEENGRFVVVARKKAP